MSSRTPSIYSDAPEIPTDESVEDMVQPVDTTPDITHQMPPVNSDHLTRPSNGSQSDSIADSAGDSTGRQRHYAAEQEFGASRRQSSAISTEAEPGNQMDIDDEQQEESQEDMQMHVDQTPSQSLGAFSEAVSSPSASQPVADSIPNVPQPATISSAATNPIGRTVSVPVIDEKAQAELRRKIMEIQRDPKISFPEKAGLIQKLMSGKWRESQKTTESSNEGSGDASEDDLKATYYNEEQNQLGCKHYRRGCKLKANCCGKWFNCRFCHDDVSDHVIIRSETKQMLCMHCKTIQDAAQTCYSCKARLAVYYCDVCKLWDDSPQKPIYHCDDCGICRIGQGLGRDYFHCKKCNVCMTISLQGNHKCIERNLECDCPICGEYMFTSTTTVIFMPCGHCIHAKCHEEYTKTSYQCPTCWKSLGDMTAYYSKIDSLLAEQTMPPDYANIYSIVLCNDCEVKSEAPYHFLYHKCDKCKGYNTKVLETFRRIADGQVQAVENAASGGPSGTAPEDNASGSNHSFGGHSSAATDLPMGATGVPGVSGGSSNVISGTAPVNLANVERSRSPIMDGNASGDMSMAGISGNSAP
ncbi:RING finger and CHY zinc finger domain-containing protein 1 [Entomortierella parvispora]|uniref:RING finger and CHY zinc finger domain-containing protein 1 n=1 Tax=Entomortierella parvispora TaxID=205924 RepID=A0A9P3HDC0_9FUNG|nr:RING finger and CHY zinc finger domain-containing protein 1 [Entomortierella parvispora]